MRNDSAGMKRGGGAWMRRALIALACALAVSCCALAGCQSAPRTQAPAEGAAPAIAEEGADADADAAARDDAQTSASATTTELPGTFTNVDAGAWGDTQYAQAVNAGNRGCNSCHADLFSVLPKGMNSKGLHEVDKPAAYGRIYTYNDCATCHVHSGRDGSAVGGCGPYMAPSIHGSHYANQTFLAQGGNCFSCHETDVTTGQLGMWDELKYTRMIGLGNGAPLEAVGTWIAGRGYETSTVTGGMIEHAIKLDNVVSDQAPTESAADLYSATNMDYPDIDEKTYTVTIKGVVNEKTYTLDELRVMPQTEMTYTRLCGTNGNNGGWHMANVPTKGVLLSDIIEDCGGLAEGVDSVAGFGYDGWRTPDTKLIALEECVDPNAMIALEQFGEPIEYMDGGPAYLVFPGVFAARGTKWVQDVNFVDSGDTASKTVVGFGRTNVGMWLTPGTDDQEFKVGQPVELSGCGWALSEQGGNDVTAVKLSADYGETWTEIPLPENMDRDQWVHWNATWTPEVAGTYCLTMSVDSENENAVHNDGHVIVKVVE